MKILLIPDVHLKPGIFDRAAELMKETEAERAVCLMDIADDWNRQFNLELYAQTYDAAIRFSQTFPDTLWCWGNHDICYVWDRRESGYSPTAAYLVCRKLGMLEESLPDRSQLAFLHRIDGVLFSHAGLADMFVRAYVPVQDREDVDRVVETVNGLGPDLMWQNASPLWLRPQGHPEMLYRPDILLQVVGHTPVSSISREGSLLTCDVFSTDSLGRHIGTEEYLLLDTKTLDYRGVK